MRLHAAGVGTTLVIGLLHLAPTTAQGACVKAARDLHAKTDGAKGCMVPKRGERVDVSPDGSGRCAGVDAAAGVYYYFEDKDQAQAAARTLGADLQPLENLTSCSGLWLVHGESSPPETAWRPFPTGSAAEILERYGLQEETRDGSRTMPLAQGTGAVSDVVAEGLQILGQIVVDRATQAAYELISRKIRQGLGCRADEQESGDAAPFPATCEALATLRIQDLAMARQVLIRAVVSDVTARGLHLELQAEEPAPQSRPGTADVRRDRALASLAAKAVTDGPRPDDAKKVAAMAGDMAARLLKPIIATVGDTAHTRHALVARALAAEVVSFAYANRTQVGRELRPFILAAAALLKCTNALESDKLASCPISQFVDQMREPDKDTDDVMPIARSVARGMLAAISAAEGLGHEPAPRVRLSAAIDGLFDGVCFALDPQRALGCPPILDVSSYPVTDYFVGLSVARGVIEAAVDEDSNRLFASVAAGIQASSNLLSGKVTAPQARRALRLVAGVVQYSATYRQAGGETTDEQKHEQRTKILESLTADMTGRVGREGDTILSVGGSLGLVGAGRFGSGDAIWSGPLTLSLGLAVQRVASPGIHVELGLVDLAQYLAFEEEHDMTTEGGARSSFVVARPELQDAFSPSLRVGVQWGRDVPIFVAAMGGYSPFYEFEEADGTTSRSGSFNVGLVVGAYVPLIDAN